MCFRDIDLLAAFRFKFCKLRLFCVFMFFFQKGLHEFGAFLNAHPCAAGGKGGSPGLCVKCAEGWTKTGEQYQNPAEYS
jgi:hypothetical protein